MNTELTATIDGLTLKAKSFTPKGSDKKITLVCLPGGGASAEVFDLAPGYSFVDRMTSMGYAVTTIDHPGTATNPLPTDHPFLTPRQSADYIARALKAWMGEETIIGVGHSMGGMTTTLIQAAHKPFKAIGLFGSSAGGLDWGRGKSLY